MDRVYRDSDFFDNYEHAVAPHTTEFHISKLNVFYYNHLPRPIRTTNDIPYQRISSALATIEFRDQFVFAQFWAAVDFGSCTVLTTRGQPFGVSVYTNGFWSYHLACLDHNSYVYHKKNEENVCIGVPARVFLNRSPEWIPNVERYTDNEYPQLNDALWSKIRGSLVMPVIERDQCIGVVEIIMTNCKDNFLWEKRQVCRALEEVGLQSSDQNENVNIETYKDPPIRLRKTKSSDITCNHLTKVFGLPKADAAERCELLVGAFTHRHQRQGIKEWPCKALRIVKSSAHLALINGSESEAISHETRLIIKDIESRLMQDNYDDINWEGNVAEYMDCLSSNDIDQIILEQPDESPTPVLLELYLPQ